jgi:hypothetical protein
MLKILRSAHWISLILQATDAFHARLTGLYLI